MSLFFIFMKVKFLGGLIILIFLSNSCSRISFPTDGIYLIPKNYIGDVIILFNQSDGVTPEVENGFYVYKIPQNGILKVKTKGITGIINKSYFYVDENNQRQKIDYLYITGERNPSGEPQNKFGNINQNDYEDTVFIMNAGGLGSFNTKNDVIQYTSFIVATPKNSDGLYDNMQKRISNVQREFLQNN